MWFLVGDLLEQIPLQQRGVPLPNRPLQLVPDLIPLDDHRIPLPDRDVERGVQVIRGEVPPGPGDPREPGIAVRLAHSRGVVRPRRGPGDGLGGAAELGLAELRGLRFKLPVRFVRDARLTLGRPGGLRALLGLAGPTTLTAPCAGGRGVVRGGRGGRAGDACRGGATSGR